MRAGCSVVLVVVLVALTAMGPPDGAAARASHRHAQVPAGSNVPGSRPTGEVLQVADGQSRVDIGAASPAGMPPYLDMRDQLFAIYANQGWRVATSGAPAVQISRGRPSAYNLPGGDQPWSIWAPTCATGVQPVTFVRTIWLPGPPATLTMQAAGRSDYRWPRSVAAITLLANRQLLARSGNYDSAHPSATEPSSPTRDGSIQYHTLVLDPKTSPLHFGLNRLELRVTKAPLPAAIARCDAGSPTPFGVQLWLAGSVFATDLAVKAPAPGQGTRYYRVTPGEKPASTYNLTVRNNGPAASYEGRFSFQVQSGFIELATVEHPDIGRVTPFLVTAAPPFGPCTTTPYTVTCPYATWFDPGEVRTLHISFLQKVPTDEPNTFSTEEVVGWGVTPLYGRDSNDTNNTAVLNTYFCWPAATDPPGCKTAQPFGR